MLFEYLGILCDIDYSLVMDLMKTFVTQKYNYIFIKKGGASIFILKFFSFFQLFEALVVLLCDECSH